MLARLTSGGGCGGAVAGLLLAPLARVAAVPLRHEAPAIDRRRAISAIRRAGRGRAPPDGRRRHRPPGFLASPASGSAVTRAALTPPVLRATVRALPHPKGPSPC